jgi:peroxiredoxin
MKANTCPFDRSPFVLAVLAGIVLQLQSADAVAGKFNRALDIGDQAPNWTGLVGVDGRKHALADDADAELVVIVFTCNHCPVAAANQVRLIDLQKDFADRGVRLVAICSNPGDEDGLPAMKKRAESEGYNFPYLSDSDQSVARSYGARHTPTVVVLDVNRKVRYMGAIDDNWQDAAQAQRTYLRDAIESLLAGRRVPVAETRPIGCEIPLAETDETATDR